MLRRNIANHLIFEHNQLPHEVTRALNVLSGLPEHIGIIQTEIERPGQAKKSNLYSLRPTTSEERAWVQELEDFKLEVLGINALGTAGEKYTRSLFKAAGFVRVTQERMLGRVYDQAGQNGLDLAVTNPLTGVRYGVSVKNVNEWLYPRKRFIPDCVSRAQAHNLQPWLVMPFISDAAKVRCQNDGIKITELGAQIVPAEDYLKRNMKKMIGILRETIGPQPFEYLYAGRFDRTVTASPRTQSLVAQLSRERTQIAA